MAEGGEAGELADLAKGLGRAFGGALIFGLPMLMTNEFWQIGAEMDRIRLAALIIGGVPLLVGVAHRVGFEATFGWREDLRDAFLALAIGLLATALILTLFNVVDGEEATNAAVGRIAVQVVPAALGAMLARSQFGSNRDEDGEAEERALDGYPGALFMMVVGSLFLSLNIAPTEEVIQIAYGMTPWHAIAAVVLTLGVMHAFVHGHGVSSKARPGWGEFLRFTLVGYLLALIVCLVALWLFGRIDGIGPGRLVMTVIVLAFPGGLGAAAARLLL